MRTDGGAASRARAATLVSGGGSVTLKDLFLCSRAALAARPGWLLGAHHTGTRENLPESQTPRREPSAFLVAWRGSCRPLSCRCGCPPRIHSGTFVTRAFLWAAGTSCRRLDHTCGLPQPVLPLHPLHALCARHLLA